MLLALPFLAVKAGYDLEQIDSIPVLLLDTPFFYALMDILEYFSFIMHTSVYTLLYVVAVSLVIFIIRVFLSNKVLRSMISFYRHSHIRLIPNVIISTLSLTLFIISLYYSNPYSRFDTAIFWFSRYSIVFAFFFLVLALYFTSGKLIKNKLALKNPRNCTAYGRSGFLFFCNIIYAGYLLAMVYFLHQFLLNYFNTAILLVKKDLLAIIGFCGIFFLLLGFSFILLTAMEEKKFPWYALLLILLFSSGFFFFTAQYEKTDFVQEPVLAQKENQNRIVLMGDQTIRYQFPCLIDIEKGIKNSLANENKKNLDILFENLLTAESVFSNKLNTEFSILKDWLPKIHSCSPGLIPAMLKSMQDMNHNLRSAFHLFYHLLFFGYDIPAGQELFASSFRVYDRAVLSRFNPARNLTPAALRILELTETRENRVLFNIEGHVSFEGEKPVDTDKLVIYVTLLQKADFELLLQDIQSVKYPLSRLWKYSNPFSRVQDGAFLIESVVDNGQAYRFAVIINDRDNIFKDAKSIKTNLYNMEISPLQESPCEIQLTPVFNHIPDDDE